MKAFLLLCLLALIGSGCCGGDDNEFAVSIPDSFFSGFFNRFLFPLLDDYGVLLGNQLPSECCYKKLGYNSFFLFFFFFFFFSAELSSQNLDSFFFFFFFFFFTFLGVKVQLTNLTENNLHATSTVSSSTKGVDMIANIGLFFKTSVVSSLRRY